jgi:large subunit ribosomal protein L25
MQRIELNVAKRDTAINARKIRRNGRVPAIIYGAGGANVAVDVNEREFVRLGLGSSGAHLIRFSSSESGLAGGIALVRDIQVNPVSGRPVHVDFLRVDPNKPVEASVALAFVGKAVGLLKGGIVQPLRRELEVRALPDALPEQIEVDVTALDVHDSLHVADVALPTGVEPMFTENYTLVTVVPPTVEAAPTAQEGEAEAAAPAAEAGEKKEG